MLGFEDGCHSLSTSHAPGTPQASSLVAVEFANNGFDFRGASLHFHYTACDAACKLRASVASPRQAGKLSFIITDIKYRSTDLCGK